MVIFLFHGECENAVTVFKEYRIKMIAFIDILRWDWGVAEVEEFGITDNCQLNDYLQDGRKTPSVIKWLVG